MLELLFDADVDIAYAKHRNAPNWGNKAVKWSWLVTKFSKTHRTAETVKEYLAADKPRQAEIKDVGGFVGGFLNGGRRGKTSVLHRQLVTLDLDFCTYDFWEDWILQNSCAACLYSTHKHTKDNPRYRLIVPLDREVNSDEYEAIARKIAGNLDIEIFDATTFQPNRLMFWPSTPKDGEYIFKYTDEVFLRADDVLAQYEDWHDTRQWPVHAKLTGGIQRGMKKAGEPTEKGGAIGAFCRTYTISEAIDCFLGDVYTPTDVNDRYTFKGGSTAGGLITYDDTFAYSHHGTDPAGEILCNAFDLVRIHKFGLEDHDSDKKTPIHKLPSYSKMCEFATSDRAVRKELAAAQVNRAVEDFAGVDVEKLAALTLADNVEWMADLERDKKGAIFHTLNNFIHIIENDPLLKDRLARNELSNQDVWLTAAPWDKDGMKYPRQFTDVDDVAMRHYFERVYNIEHGSKIADSTNLVLERNRFHPVRDYLDSVVWDGLERIDALAIDFLGAEDNRYNRIVMRKSLIGAVRRAFEPGCKHDTMIVLVGAQGAGKSTFVSKLGGQWFSDSFTTIQGKEAYEALQGVWLIEIGELAAMKRNEVEVTKHFISKASDRYRGAFEKRIKNNPRQCIFFGTTNEDRGFLKDETGARRFWPIRCGVGFRLFNVWADMTPDVVGQIWAEAVEAYKAGETNYLDVEDSALATEVQKEHTETDERASMVTGYLDTLLPDNWDELDLYSRRLFLSGEETMFEKGEIQRCSVCVTEVWQECYGNRAQDMSRQAGNEIHRIIKNMEGWEMIDKKYRDKRYGVVKGYKRVASVAAII